MNSITRRLFLRNTGAAGAAIALPVAAAKADVPASAEERMAYHFEQFKKAASEIQPRIRFQRQDWDFNSEHAPILILATLAKGYYAGDGLYYGGSKYSDSMTFAVRLLDGKEHGERVFSVIPTNEPDRRKWMVLDEPQLDAFIGAKIEGGQL